MSGKEIFWEIISAIAFIGWMAGILIALILAA